MVLCECLVPEITSMGPHHYFYYLSQLLKMYVVKESYKNSLNKRTVQREVYQQIKGRYKHLIGLGGPDLDDYLKFARYAGIKNAIIYEYNVDQLLIQASKNNSTLPTRVIFDDIISCPSGVENAFYDLDFCCSVNTATPHINKFRNDPVAFTFSIRPLGLRDSVRNYVRCMQNNTDYEFNLIESSSSFRRYELVTNRAVQTAYIYQDTVPMLVISSNLSYL